MTDPANRSLPGIAAALRAGELTAAALTEHAIERHERLGGPLAAYIHWDPDAARAAAGRVPIRVRIGLHSGQVTVGNIGAPGRINYTIVGNTVNTANRIEQLAKEIPVGEDDVAILLGAATVELAGVGFAPRAVGRHRLRGQQEELVVFAL